MERFSITREDVDRLDDIILKVETLSALATVCGSAFIERGSFSNMNPRDVHNSFNNMSRQLQEVYESANAIMVSIYGSRTEKEGAEND